ncbi:hypothetical protein GGI43DRAFT_413909 [Trichoderma evansii]
MLLLALPMRSRAQGACVVLTCRGSLGRFVISNSLKPTEFCIVFILHAVGDNGWRLRRRRENAAQRGEASITSRSSMPAVGADGPGCF